MTENWKNDLVQVFVPKRTGGGYIATGYPVAPNKVLTARHVFFDADCCAPDRAEVRWFHRKDADGNWRPVKELLWDGGDDFDAALIDCAFPEGWIAYAMLSDSPPYGSARYESEGFAKEGTTTDRQQPVPLKGETYSAADSAMTFIVGVDDPSTLPEAWEGASGSPVICGRELVGVISRCPSVFGNRRLHAAPVWKLLEIDDFCSKVGFTRRDDRPVDLEPVRLRLRAQLSAISEEALAVMCAEFKCQGARGADQVRAVIEAFFGQSIHAFIPVARKAFKAVVLRREWMAARAIKRAVLDVLPALFDDHQLVRALRGRKGEVAFGLLELPVSSQTVAEVLMAAADERPAALMRDRDNAKLFKSSFAIEFQPQAGFTRGAEQFRKDFESHLAAEVGFGRRFDGNTYQEAIATVREAYQRYADYGETRYYVVNVPTDESDQREARIAIQDLKRTFPGIVFLTIDREDWTILRKQKTIFDPFEDIIGEDVPESV